MRDRVGQDFTTVAFFCHGWANGIQLGFRIPQRAMLADLIYDLTRNDAVVVPLYCCSTGVDAEGDEPSTPGWGDGSFGDRMRDALCAAGATDCRVFAHTTVGHTSMNPHVVFFDGMGIATGGVGGFAPVAPRSINWKAWVRALRDPKGTLRCRAPFMEPNEIHREIS